MDNMEQLQKGFEEAIAKELPSALENSVKNELTAQMKEYAEQNEAIKTELQAMKAAASVTNYKNLDEAKAKSVVVNTFRNVKKFGVSSEEQFKEIFEAQVKETFQNESTATDGAEFVFDIFSRDVYSIFEQFDLVSELRTINITGKSINLPRYDGGVEAYWIDEGANFTGSKADTGNLKIDIYKLGVLVTMTDEMMADDMTTETLYSLIIEETGVKFAGKIEDEVLNGNNTTGKMKGILTNPNIKVVTSTATSFADISENDIYNADALIDDKYDINPANKVALMLKSTLNSLRTKRDPSTGVLLFPELRTNNPTLVGYRVITSSKMPAEATGAVGVLMGNVRDFYYHVSRQGFNAEMGYLSGDFQAGKKSLRIDRRDGGAVKDGNAFATIEIGTVA